MRRPETQPAGISYPSWWQVETLLNGDEDRRSREVRFARRARRTRARRALMWGAVVVVVSTVIAMSVASGMLSEAAGLAGDFLTRIGLS